MVRANVDEEVLRSVLQAKSEGKDNETIAQEIGCSIWVLRDILEYINHNYGSITIAVCGAIQEGFIIGPEPLQPATPLTWYESEVTELLSQGLSNEEMAGRCGLSVSALKRHIGRAKQKFRITGRELGREVGDRVHFAAILRVNKRSS